MTSTAPRQAQRGVALWLLLTLIALAVSYAFYRNANLQYNRQGQDAKLMAVLVRAKEALIARAVTDDNRPGSLPCPDLITDSDGLNNHPYDGKRDDFTRNDCPSYVGWLPWVTLDLPELTDDSGTRLWYVLAKELRDDDSAQPINSDTAPGLTVDGNANSDIAALIIAPRGALSGQSRPSKTPSAYLDGENGNGDSVYVTGPASDTFNDVVMIVTRQELMAAVEKRVANELRSCLEQHAASADNPTHAYPRPAPLAGTVVTEVTYTDLTRSTLTTNKGNASSLFGRVPDTQAGNPQQTLKEIADKIRITQTSLISASTAENQLALTQQLQAQVAYALAFHDRLFISAVDLDSKARASSDAYQAFDDWLTVATENKTSYTANSLNLPAEIQKAQPSLLAFRGALANIGVDLFLIEMGIQNPQLKTDIDAAAAIPIAANFNTLLKKVNLLKNNVLEYSWTPNPDIADAISAAYTAASNAAISVRAASKNQSPSQVSNALTGATALYEANRQIEAAVLAARNNLSGGDNVTLETLTWVATTLDAAQAQIPSTVSAAQALRSPTQAAKYWSGLAIAQAADLARLARRGIVGGKLAIDDSNTSAYTAARQLLDSLDGDTGSIALLDKYIKNPDGDSSIQAQAALQKNMSQLQNKFWPATDNLAATLLTSQAEATVPMIWFGTGCAFLKPTSSTGSWWTANHWKTLAFYQLSGATQATPGKLTVNATGSYRTVTLMAGRTLPGQNRATLTVDNFLEGINADTSRNGDATTPTTGFTASPPSTTFNDRLSF